MKRAARQIALSAVILLAFCAVCRLAFSNVHLLHVPLYSQAEEDRQVRRLEVENPEVLSVGDLRTGRDMGRVPLRPLKPGRTSVRAVNSSGETITRYEVRVDRFLTIHEENNGGFTGDTAALIAVTLFFLLVSGIMLWNFFQARGPAFYSYTTIYFAGFSLFALVTGVQLLAVTVSHLLDPVNYSMLSAYAAIYGASARFLYVTLPLILCFAAALAVSNIALLRHERYRPQNVLGILAALLLVIGAGGVLYLVGRNASGPEWEIHLRTSLENVCATVYVYFECMLAGSVVCGVKAARHRPDRDKDFIIILGCWFRRDGSLPPLLRGRVDRAIAFWRSQKAETGKEAVFIPSGGQGGNESMPEAEAMARYLREQGVPPALIRLEDKSRNTFQNMAFSGKIVREEQPAGKVVFATTNYHVFRSGVWAARAGLPAEGIGSRTKWWFWPNAFMRECVGLLAARWKTELLLLLVLMAFFWTLSMVLW